LCKILIFQDVEFTVVDTVDKFVLDFESAPVLPSATDGALFERKALRELASFARVE